MQHLLHVLQVLRAAGLMLFQVQVGGGYLCLSYHGARLPKPKRLQEDDDSKIFPYPSTKTAVRSYGLLPGFYSLLWFTFTSADKCHQERDPRHYSMESRPRIYLKQCLCSKPLLSIAVPTDNFYYRQASGLGIGAVLAIIRQGVEHPVSYYSLMPSQTIPVGRSNCYGHHSAFRGLLLIHILNNLVHTPYSVSR